MIMVNLRKSFWDDKNGEHFLATPEDARQRYYKEAYCAKQEGAAKINCRECYLNNYGRDCQNNPI